jgi:hypothetical protein
MSEEHTMKKTGLLCAVFGCLILLPHVVAATDWVLLRQDHSLNGNFAVYVDPATVIQSGETIGYWVLHVYDAPDPLGVKKDLSKWEAKQTKPILAREVETYWYDATGEELHTAPDMYQGAKFTEYLETAPVSRNTIAATRYAKEGTLATAPGTKPTP